MASTLPYEYFDFQFKGSDDEFHKRIAVGSVRRIIMGLDSVKKTPCGFCFVEYFNRSDTDACVRYVNATRLDNRIIRVDYDHGFEEGRQFGRGKKGGQTRDDRRAEAQQQDDAYNNSEHPRKYKRFS